MRDERPLVGGQWSVVGGWWLVVGGWWLVSETNLIGCAQGFSMPPGPPFLPPAGSVLPASSSVRYLFGFVKEEISRFPQGPIPGAPRVAGVLARRVLAPKIPACKHAGYTRREPPMVLWYHLIMTAYGFWLPNDPRG